MAKPLATTAALALIAGLGLSSFAFAQTTTAETTTAPATTETPAAPAAIDPATIPDYGIGQMDAKVKIVEYLSFTCPHCAAFHSEVYPQLKADYIDTGKVRLEYHEVYFDRYGLWAAMMARCGGEMRYMGITDIVLDTQQDWAGSDDPNVVVENLKKIGRTAGMDDAQLDICMKDAAMADALVKHFETNMAADKIEGTPTFIINGTKHSNMAYDDLKAVLDAELAK
ncbi:thiol-disulfide oxidoreductase [Cypionkella aquatica]|uniref:Thiol-disulfide oxidoreductase n=1 Tax=Cypionkella aquatica TaxID=1756042 RepID=A0AA37X3W6_9RHOB|nr:DsbA family protein [Cypionkella aquatica]GLS88730.1 thiol-disulfide oxidoreductase [Cypionkella aquatica]